MLAMYIDRGIALPWKVLYGANFWWGWNWQIFCGPSYQIFPLDIVLVHGNISFIKFFSIPIHQHFPHQKCVLYGKDGCKII